MYPMDFDDPQFLEPAHFHNPAHISHIADLPSSLVKSIPSSFQDVLTTLQESTSIAFASLGRLRNLVEERFHRLVPAKNQPNDANSKLHERQPLNYSEPAFFNYTNHLQAEKRYLLEEALPDWRHKAMRLDHEQQQFDTKIVFRDMTGTVVDFKVWWAALKSEVGKWVEEAEDTEIPEFDDTVAEYRVFQAREIRRESARSERRSRKIMLELDIPETRKLEKTDTIDSGIGMGVGSDCDEYEFAT